MLVRNKRGDYQALKNYKGSSDELVVNKDHNSLVLLSGEHPGGYIFGDEVLIQGPDEVVAGSPNVFTIVNYDAFSEYQITSNVGEIDKDGSIFSLHLEEEVPSVELTLSKSRGSTRVLSIPGSVNVGPGPRTLSAGDEVAGFFGEVSPEELIGYDELADIVGLTAGSDIDTHNEESHWLKYSLDSSILFVAKKPARSGMSWNQLNSVGVVYGETIVNIRGHNFKCRLLKGAGVTSGSLTSNTFDPPESHGSEWNRLMYPVHSGEHFNSSNPTTPEMGTWAQYSDTDLYMSGGAGAACWCQETFYNRIRRGSNGVTYFNVASATAVLGSNGWRPVLELVK